MSNRALPSQTRGASLAGHASRAIGVGVIVAWVVLLALPNTRPVFASRFECGSDPWDILRIGEMLEPSSLAFLVQAHCTNAKYSPDGWIELKYGGARFDVELRRLEIGGRPYFQIVSIGGVAEP